jgi:nitroreductase
LPFPRPVTEIIRQRYSCRSYRNTPIEQDKCALITETIAALHPGPFGVPARFKLVAATEQDRDALRGLGTYGFIRGAPAFIIGAAQASGKSLEDFGYQMESLVLSATTLGLGTCWLGGSFSRSSFSRKISCGADEIIPCVCALGYPSEDRRAFDAALRRRIGGRERRPWESFFFDGDFGAPLSHQQAGVYATPLEMVRLAPSASNKQPWRVIQQQDRWHFYLQRTKGYREGWLTRLLGVADMQRVDMGIATSHFEQAVAEMGAKGRWQVCDPGFEPPDALTEYEISWIVGS